MYPANPVAAASHANPYPYYDSLLQGPPLVFNEQLKLWVASRASVIREVFASPHCTVRPAAEQVPIAIAGSSAGGIFSYLIRMNEGVAHEGPRSALQQGLASLDISGVGNNARSWSATLAASHDLRGSIALTPWMFDLPVFVVGELLGFTTEELPRVASWMRDFVRCLSPLSTSDQLAASSLAAQELLRSFADLLQNANVQDSSLAARIQQEAASVGWDNQDAILANLVGLLSQTYEATAGLIGNCIVALVSHPHLQDVLRRDPGQIDDLVLEVCRFDSPVQNTRRFVGQTTTIADMALQAGDTILLLLAAAGRDGQANTQPNEFMLQRADRQIFGFGQGRHACPGQKLAIAIATAAMQSLLAMPLALAAENIQWTYRPSANGRIPEFMTIHQPS